MTSAGSAVAGVAVPCRVSCGNSVRRRCKPRGRNKSIYCVAVRPTRRAAPNHRVLAGSRSDNASNRTSSNGNKLLSQFDTEVATLEDADGQTLAICSSAPCWYCRSALPGRCEDLIRDNKIR